MPSHPWAGELALVYEGEGLKVEMLAVGQSTVVPAVGYRFSYKGRSPLITGETTKQAKITHAILNYHTSVFSSFIGIINAIL